MDEDEGIETIEPTDDSGDSGDPVLTHLSSRARDLSLAISNPATLASKLREELESIAGDASILYHIGAKYDGERVDVQISRLSPSTVARFNLTRLGSHNQASLSMAYHRTLASGWELSVGADLRAEWGSGDVEKSVEVSVVLRK